MLDELNNPMEIPYPRKVSGKKITELPSGMVPAHTVLKGQYVQLEPQNPKEHTDELYKQGHKDDTALKIWEYLPYGPWKNRDDYEKVIRQQAASFDPIFYTIRTLHDQQINGQASYLRLVPEHGVIEIGHIWFSQELQKTRAATESLYLLLELAMEQLSYRRMEWKCNALNENSRNAAKRLGFRFEGIFYNHAIFKGHNRDSAWFSILGDEWPEVRTIIKNWLKPTNFNEDNSAKTSLSEEMKKRAI